MGSSIVVEAEPQVGWGAGLRPMIRLLILSLAISWVSPFPPHAVAAEDELAAVAAEDVPTAVAAEDEAAVAPAAHEQAEHAQAAGDEKDEQDSEFVEPVAVPSTAKELTETLELLERIRNVMLRDSRGSVWGVDGNVKILQLEMNEWELAVKRIEAYRAHLAAAIKAPSLLVLQSPRAYLRLARLITWGETTAVGVPRLVRRGYRFLEPVVAAPARRRARASDDPSRERVVRPVDPDDALDDEADDLVGGDE